MDNQNKTTGPGLAGSLQSLANTYSKTMKAAIENVSVNMKPINQLMSNMGIATFSLPSSTKENECCPPKAECPPHCLMELGRQAYAGERIIVPFGVKNACKNQKHYRIGVLELKNINGSPAPSQPILNKQNVTLDNGETEMVLMMIELKGFEPGTYNAEIVIREKDINQNICFTLKVDNFDNLAVAEPLEEIKYRQHWQSWQRHYYCETPKNAAGTVGIEQ
jgi:hypothetical protein